MTKPDLFENGAKKGIMFKEDRNGVIYDVEISYDPSNGIIATYIMPSIKK